MTKICTTWIQAAVAPVTLMEDDATSSASLATSRIARKSRKSRSSRIACVMFTPGGEDGGEGSGGGGVRQSPPARWAAMAVGAPPRGREPAALNAGGRQVNQDSPARLTEARSRRLAGEADRLGEHGNGGQDVHHERAVPDVVRRRPQAGELEGAAALVLEAEADAQVDEHVQDVEPAKHEVHHRGRGGPPAVLEAERHRVRHEESSVGHVHLSARQSPAPRRLPPPLRARGRRGLEMHSPPS